MQSFSRIFIGGAGLLLASVGGIALIAVINTWRLYSLPVAMTIAFGFVTAFIFVSGIVFVAIAIRGKVPSRRRATGLGYIPEFLDFSRGRKFSSGPFQLLSSVSLSHLQVVTMTFLVNQVNSLSISKRSVQSSSF
ncbi:hypothetical protein E6H11_04430 [Candidatus Bathyarchaeota archaeon]|nr:MAG: hypothetical protein E6H11_04430 [Candidatus Bathyarchaeota archaeon]